MDVPLAWHWVDTVRRMVVQELATHDPELRAAAEMVASELAENVVRYGQPTADSNAGLVVLSIEDDVLRISSSNGATPERAAVVLECLRRLEHEDAEQLALERMKAMIENPEDRGSQLGLLRIAFEGQFSLSAEVENGVLRITAWRPIR